MSSRVKGYRYVIGKDGKKRRVYDNAKIASMSGSGAYRVRSKKPAMRGRGGYYDSGFVKTMKSIIPRGSFASGGSMLGNQLLGGPHGGVIGGLAGTALSKLLGFGAYTLKSNSLVSEGETPARMHSNSANTVVRHREYITDIVSSSSANTFNLQSFDINPGLFGTFPWISSIAQQFQEWIPLGIVFEFKTLSADAIASSTNNTLGGIIMATNYNSASANFANKQAMDNTEYTTSCKPSESFYHPIECARSQNVLPELYIRSGSVPSGQDQKTYDLGNFQIASFGIQGTSVVLGELWISYDIELRKPISTSAQGLDVLSDHFQLGTVTNSAPFGTTSVLQVGSSIGGTITGTGTIYNFNVALQEGNFLFYWLVKGTSGAQSSPSISYTNCSVLTLFYGDTSGSPEIPVSGSSGTQMSIILIVKLTGINAAITFTSPTLPSTITAGDIWVTQMNGNIVT